MKKVYLIRHGKPCFPEGKRMCLGRTDLAMGEEGFIQANLMAETLKDKEIEVFSSPLLRAIQTAEALKRPVTVINDLQELYAGQWDGLDFDEIKLRYPELFAARANDRSIPLPGGEDHEAGLRRFSEAMHKAAELSRGDFALVAHGGIIGLFLKQISGTYYKPDYCEIVELIYENNNFSLAGGNNNA